MRRRATREGIGFSIYLTFDEGAMDRYNPSCFRCVVRATRGALCFISPRQYQGGHPDGRTGSRLRYEVSRRKFLSGLIGAVAGTVAAVVAIPAIAYVTSPGVKLADGRQWMTLGPVSSVVPGVPTPLMSRMIEDGWVKSLQSGTAYAVTTGAAGTQGPLRCMHPSGLPCQLAWGSVSITSVPVTTGFFSVEGQVVSGPPPRPLSSSSDHASKTAQIQIQLEA